MPPRKAGKAKAQKEEVDSTPVRRSTRATRSGGAQEEIVDEASELEPPKKKPRGKRSSAAPLNTDEDENSNETSKNKIKEAEIEAASDLDSGKTPVKNQGRKRKVLEHKDTPIPKELPKQAIKSEPRGRKRRGQSDDVPEEIVQSPISEDQPKRTKISEKNATTEPCPAEAKPVEKKADEEPKKIIEAKSSTVKVEETSKNSSANHSNGHSTISVKQPSGYERNSNIEEGTSLDLSVASIVTPTGDDALKNLLNKLDKYDLIALQKATPKIDDVAKACGYKTVGEGSTRLLLKSTPGTNQLRIAVEGTPEQSSLIELALAELTDFSSKDSKTKIENYLAAHCSASDEFSVYTLSVNGKTFTLVNVQLESKNQSITSLLIGCLMRKLDPRPHAFVFTGHMPNVGPDSPAYELLRDGYFGNHSIETLQLMQDIKVDDEEDINKGLIDFLWRAYQHSRPWMRSVYETVLNAESVVSSKGTAAIWHSTKGVDVVGVLNDEQLVTADLLIKNCL